MSSPLPDAEPVADPAEIADIAAPPVPQPEQQPQFQPAGRLRYKPRRNLFASRTLRLVAVIVLLALCGVAIMARVQRMTGTSGLLIGVALAVLPVPLVLGAFYWLDRIEPKPLRNLLFCFAWGACAATLVALLANTWATSLLIEHQVGSGETLGASVVAPLVEESAKGSAILLLFLFRRRDFSGIVDGIVYAGFTATGFAFTENILYIGRSVGDGSKDGQGFALTLLTFLQREVMSPFAHPLFTGMTGVGFGVAAMTRKRWLRILAPIGGWVCAMIMHGTWNGSSTLGGLGFLGVYFLFMVPVFGLMVWLVVWSRRSELLVVQRQLPVYATAGWLPPQVPLVLSAMRTRRQSEDLARFTQGQDGARAMAEYLGFATSLAFLRQRAERGLAGRDFTEREQELLHHLWERRDQVAEVFVRVGAQEWYRTHPQPPRPYAYPGGYGLPQTPHPGYGPPPGPYPGPGYGFAQRPAPGGQGYPQAGPNQGHPQPGPGYGYPQPGPGYSHLQPGPNHGNLQPGPNYSAPGHPAAAPAEATGPNGGYPGNAQDPFAVPDSNTTPRPYQAPGPYAAPSPYGTPPPYGTPGPYAAPPYPAAAPGPYPAPTPYNGPGPGPYGPAPGYPAAPRYVTPSSHPNQPNYDPYARQPSGFRRTNRPQPHPQAQPQPQPQAPAPYLPAQPLPGAQPPLASIPQQHRHPQPDPAPADTPLPAPAPTPAEGDGVQ
ncbi:PrsW family intramembrane metalloprotease [Streptacidiphilus cavernicola]|uniref:PrsW family intramembrane metalloprotease n=1 Tax=Streptacidiphilus cavernicola TaxID=3342716 RepID=A0ABV6VYA1_9ACTN